MIQKTKLLVLSEYSSQLPTDGGAFYHPDTIETARQHYKKSWPPILYALCVWLKEKGLGDPMGEKSGEREGVPHTVGPLSLQPANVPANMKPQSLNQDRFYLILGESSQVVKFSCPCTS